MSLYHISSETNNKKTGKIVILSSSEDTCPDNCPLKNGGCYGKYGPLRLHWDKVSNGERGRNFNETLTMLKEIALKDIKKYNKRNKRLLRLFQVGDMPGRNNNIDFAKIKRFVNTINFIYNSFGYTHKPLNIKKNIDSIKYCNNNGVVINLSANTLEEADLLLQKNIGPVVVALCKNVPKVLYTPMGNKVIVCPATFSDNIQCINCGNGKPLCSRIDRNFIIGFPAHGSGYRKVEKVFNETRY